jgi:RNase P subunit RPR2
MKAYFCNKCHRQIVIPKWVNSGAIKSESAITVKCGNCGKGKIKIIPENKVEETKEIENYETK